MYTPMSQWGQQNLNSQAMNYGLTPNSLNFSGAQPFGIPNVNPTADNASGGFFDQGNNSFGWNANTMQFGIQGLNTLGNLWGAWNAQRLARDQLDFTKSFARANMENQTKAYNTALEDRARSRGFVEGQTTAEQQAYIDRNRLPNRG